MLPLLLWFYFQSKHNTALKTTSKIFRQVSNSIKYEDGGKSEQRETEVLERVLQCSAV